MVGYLSSLGLDYQGTRGVSAAMSFRGAHKLMCSPKVSLGLVPLPLVAQLSGDEFSAPVEMGLN